MSPSELEDYLTLEPLRPVRLTLSSGDQLVVYPEDRPLVEGLVLILRLVLDDGEEVVCRQPRKSLVSGDHIAVVGICGRPNAGGVKKLRMVNIDRVKSAELLPADAG